MKFWFSSKPKYFLVLDVGREAVRALIFKKEKDKLVILSYSCEKNIHQAIEAVKAETGFKPLKVFLTLPADILKGRIIFKSFSRGNALKIIDKNEEENIYRSVLKQAQQSTSQIFFQNSGILPEELEFIELKILETKLNGYQVSDLRGRKGKDLEFRIFASFLPKFYLDNLKRDLKTLGLKSFKISHQAQNIGSISQQDEMIAIEVREEFTQIFLRQNGKLTWIAEFDGGSNNFIRSLSHTFGLSPQGAKDFIERYLQRSLSEETRARLREIFLDIAKEWLFGLKSKLKEFKGLPPSTFFIFGEGAEIPEIQEVLSEENWQIKLIHPKVFQNIIDTTHTLNKPRDISLISLSYAESA